MVLQFHVLDISKIDTIIWSTKKHISTNYSYISMQYRLNWHRCGKNMCRSFSLNKPWGFHGFPLIFPWVFHGFSMVLPWGKNQRLWSPLWGYALRPGARPHAELIRKKSTRWVGVEPVIVGGVIPTIGDVYIYLYICRYTVYIYIHHILYIYIGAIQHSLGPCWFLK